MIVLVVDMIIVGHPFLNIAGEHLPADLTGVLPSGDHDPETPFYLEDGDGIPPGYQDGIPSLENPQGIPPLQDRYTHSSGRATFTIPNCPGYGGRRIQTLYERHTLEGGGSRTFTSSGILKCMDCSYFWNPISS